MMQCECWDLFQKELAEEREHRGLDFHALKLSRRFLDWLQRHYEVQSFYIHRFDSLPQYDDAGIAPEERAVLQQQEYAQRRELMAHAAWMDYYAEGQWGMRLCDVNALAQEQLECLRNCPFPKKGRFFWAKDGAHIYIRWFGRDVYHRDYTWDLCEKRTYRKELAKQRRQWNRHRLAEKRAQEELAALAAECRSWNPEDAMHPEEYRKCRSYAELEAYLDAFDWSRWKPSVLSEVHLLLRFGGRTEAVYFQKWEGRYEFYILEMEMRPRHPEDIPADILLGYETMAQDPEWYSDRMRYEQSIQFGHRQYLQEYGYFTAIPDMPEEVEVLAVLTERECIDWKMRKGMQNGITFLDT